MRSVGMGLMALMVLGACDSQGTDPGETTNPTTATTTTATQEDATSGTDTSDPTTATSATEEDATTPSDTSAPTDTTVTPDTTEEPPNKLGERLTFATETIDIASGKERQVCKIINIPGDKAVDIVRIESRMSGTSHHFNLYKVINDRKLEPASEQEATTHDCDPASEQLGGDAAYIYGAATGTRTMDTPSGVAFHLEPGQRLILEYHGLNYTPGTMTGNVEVDLVMAAPEVEIQHHADIMWFADWFFFLPEGESSNTAACSVDYDVEVFMVMSHFHELGTKFDISKDIGGTKTPFYTSDDWAHPEVMYFDPPMPMAQGDKLEWTCHWDNWRGRIVTPGKNSTDEMCMVFAAAYPKNSLSAEPIQCNIGLGD